MKIIKCYADCCNIVIHDKIDGDNDNDDEGNQGGYEVDDIYKDDDDADDNDDDLGNCDNDQAWPPVLPTRLSSD